MNNFATFFRFTAGPSLSATVRYRKALSVPLSRARTGGRTGGRVGRGGRTKVSLAHKLL